MTLIDCFNTFQNVAKSLKLSANARSLYIAILGEFNSARYPDTLSITNRVLQDISGINAESSFHSARNALLNAELIRHKKQVYRLTPEAALEKLCRRRGATLELPCSQLGVGLEFSDITTSPITIPKIEKDIEKEKITTTTAATRARENGEPSQEIKETWTRCEGEMYKPSYTWELHDLEILNGTEKLCKAIVGASQYNRYEKLTLPLIKKFLENQQKGATTNDQHGKYNRIDICPE